MRLHSIVPALLLLACGAEEPTLPRAEEVWRWSPERLWGSPTWTVETPRGFLAMTSRHFIGLSPTGTVELFAECQICGATGSAPSHPLAAGDNLWFSERGRRGSVLRLRSDDATIEPVPLVDESGIRSELDIDLDRRRGTLAAEGDRILVPGPDGLLDMRLDGTLATPVAQIDDASSVVPFGDEYLVLVGESDGVEQRLVRLDPRTGESRSTPLSVPIDALVERDGWVVAVLELGDPSRQNTSYGFAEIVATADGVDLGRIGDVTFPRLSQLVLRSAPRQLVVAVGGGYSQRPDGTIVPPDSAQILGLDANGEAAWRTSLSRGKVPISADFLIKDMVVSQDGGRLVVATSDYVGLYDLP